jgi:UDP-2,4-diacetamido-2,4,6-trideoxy-beta-L-altropyranose hydrolase
MPRIVFRCDASDTISGGHVARCMALARELSSRGARVELVTRSLPAQVRSLLVQPAGVTVHDLPQPSDKERRPKDEGAPLAHAGWLEVQQRVDAAQTAAALAAGERPDWLVVDHYALDARWERAVRAHAERILVIDDLADRDHACDALLDQNFFLDGSARYAARVPADAELMLGPRYALLRAEFALARTRLRERDGKLARVLVCFGGFDEAQQTVRALEGIESARLEGVRFDVVIGAGHAQRERIEAWCARHPEAALHAGTDRIAELMAEADLTLGASGVMNWERACLKLPSIIASVADNQHPVARDLAAHCACIYLGRADEWRAQTLAALLQGLAGAPHLMRALAARNASLTDGQGARRVAQRLLPRKVALRRAGAGDGAAIHAWRNAEETRHHSADARAIPLAEHERWFERVLADPATALLIGEDAGEPVGVLRYDVRDAEAIVSVYLVPGKTGGGWGTALLRAGTRWLRDRYPQVKHLRAAVNADNARSLAAFTNAGYRLDMYDYILDVRHD